MPNFKSIRALFCTLAITLATTGMASDFFSSEMPPSLFSIGVRLGLNSSNRTFPASAFNRWNVNSWGTGLDAGCVVDLNLRDYLTIQPGIFVESRSGNYAYTSLYYNTEGKQDDFSQLGHDRSFNITIPIVASLRFNLSNDVKAIAEAGPYFQYYLHDSASDKIQVLRPQILPTDYVITDVAKPASFDAGLKIGWGIAFKRKYSFYIHYLAGAKRAWKEPEKGGRNKSWLFTVGYDL